MREKQVIHHDRKYQVITNSPIFEKQLALDEYWKEIGGTIMLPGTNRAADRFARASCYISAIPKDESPDLTIESVFSVIRNVSVPYGITTRWRTVSHQKRLIDFFESAITPNTSRVNLNEIDFSEHGKVMKLDLGKNQSHVFAGNVAKDFQATAVEIPRTRTIIKSRVLQLGIVCKVGFGNPGLVIPSPKRQGHFSAWSVPRYKSVAIAKSIADSWMCLVPSLPRGENSGLFTGRGFIIDIRRISES